MFCSSPDHHFWADSVSLLDESLFRPALIGGHQKITDAYLNYEQFTYEKSQLGTNADLLKENMISTILIYEHRPIAVDLPIFIELKVVDAEPGVRGDTASGGSKPAKVETGATIKVPLYLEVGETIKIDTRTRAFVERVR